MARSGRRPREQRTRSRREPPQPISDLYEALTLLRGDFADKTERCLKTRGTNGPHIQVLIFKGAGGGFSDSRTYPVTDEVLKTFLDRRWVRGKRKLGSIDMTELIVTTAGHHAYSELHAAQK